MKNWILNKLANEETYYVCFLVALIIYSLIGCCFSYWIINYHLREFKVFSFFFLLGGVAIGYVSRLVHNLARMKVNDQ